MKRRLPSLLSRAAFLTLLYLLSLSFSAHAQAPTPTPAPTPVINQSNDPLLKNFRWRAIGPASMGGRIDDIAVVESNPYIIYVGFATGGVWKTVNNGTTWDPIFETYSNASIGDIAVSQSDPNIVWVGTGEANNRQSASIGDGIYKSIDAGKTFVNMGLKDSQCIARIVIDPKDANIIYVAVLGHLFGPNAERGVYKTVDGGKTWTNVKFIDEDTGFTDLVMDPADNKILYAASYQRRRTAWGFNGGGPGSGIWKTTDAGRTWKKLEGNGLPQGLLGRIGLDVSRSNPNVVYAQMEVGASAGTGGGEEQTAGPGESAPTPTPTLGVAAQPTPGQTAPPTNPSSGQAQPQPTPSPTPLPPPDPKKSGVWRSDDKGKTWRVVSNTNNRPMYYSQIRVDPKNEQIVYTGGAPFFKTIDGGKNFQVVQGIAHSDHHAIWINPQNDNQVIIGNDGGIDISYDQGATWEFVNTLPVGQFYAVAVDLRKPYNVYGGLQDNGSWGGPSQTRNAAGITNADWFRVGGGDGFYCAIDPTDPNIIYSESQNGAITRLDLKTGRTSFIRPRAAPRPRQASPRTATGTATTPPTAAGQTSEPRPAEPVAQPAPPEQVASQPAATQTQAGTPSQTPAQTQPPIPAQVPGGFGGFGGFGGVPPTSNIVPAPTPGEQYRFNWDTPIHMSPHNPRTLYVGSNKLFKTVDRGETWTASPDLTKQIDRNKLPIMGVAGDKPMASKHDGLGNYGNITTVAESPVLPGVLWVGTDDGNIQLSRDGGATWNNMAKNIEGLGDTYQVSRVEPSHFDAATCYVSIDRHRMDDYKPYVFVTRDYGATWKSITNNLPFGHINVVREDLKNKNLLYVGSEFGMFISLDGGAQWKRFMSGLPMVPVDDILVHPRDNDLIIGTHGRSVYVLDDITPLQQLADKVTSSDVFLFDVRPGTQWLQDATLSRSTGGAKNFRAVNPQAGTAISYYLKSAPAGDVKITISDVTGKVVRNITGTKETGLNRVAWNMRADPPPRPANAPAGGFPGGGQGGGGGGGGGGRLLLQFGPPLDPGVYLVKLSVGGKELTTRAVIEADTWKEQ